MKDMELRDIFTRQPIRLTKVSMYINGRWIFVGLGSPLQQTSTETYFRLPKRFGLCRSTTNSPNGINIHGDPGDYVCRSEGGILSLVKPELYNELFPPKNVNPPYTPTTSSELQDPNYITKILQESPDRPSNSIQVGTSSYFVSQPVPVVVDKIATGTGLSSARDLAPLSGTVQLPTKPTSNY